MLDQAIANTRAHLLSLRNERGHWEGELSSSALSTATAVVALSLVDAEQHAALIDGGARWLAEHQNADGGWGDTTISKSNLSTTLLCWSALSLVIKERGQPAPEDSREPGAWQAPLLATRRCEPWIRERVGSLEPDAICKAVVARYGKDKTFSVPILMTCALGGRLGERDKVWRRVLALPFELAALPRSWFGAVGLPVVSYALPALIAIGYARFHHAPPSVVNPLRWLRALLWPRIRPMLKTLQPSTGGYLEATPLTSFVTMALAGSDQRDHPCVPGAVEFLRRSQRTDGSWPIDTNLATWGTTLAVKACSSGFSPLREDGLKPELQTWLLDQQYKTIHPFTNAAPGGWAWTDLPGGVPDADDTAGALVALRHLSRSRDIPVPSSAIEAAIIWLLDLQNRDGGIPTFCRGWGTLPFDRSTPELTAHALLGWWLWHDEVPGATQARIRPATERALSYLEENQRADGSWIPLWFGNEHAKDEENPVYGTAQVVAYLSGCESLATQCKTLIESGAQYLLKTQKPDGSWGGDANAPSSIEETAVAMNALALSKTPTAKSAVLSGAARLIASTQNGTHFPAAPIGLYFARLWYHERLYPIIWTLNALHAAEALSRRTH
jgi:squalene-hopene/tetraprenyl-beta-curcumene cyclase